MLRSSLPIGSFLGVDVRVHISFPLLLVLALTLSVAFTHGLTRGFALWLALCFAVLVREVARATAAAYNGLHLRAVFLLPIGGVMAFSSGDVATLNAGRNGTRWVTISGPVANFIMGGIILVFSLAFDPHVTFFAQPWIDLHHILRSTFWTQLLLGFVSLLPSVPTRRILRSGSSDAAQGTAQKTVGRRRPAISPGYLIAAAMMILGIAFPVIYWISVLGLFVLLYTQVTARHAQTGNDHDAILVREVMLTEYTLLSSSDTLRHALDNAVHSLHDIFPVVRGNRLVGSIARQTIAERLLVDGDSYLQGAMSRNLALTSPDEKLTEALRRASIAGSTEFIPVIENDRMIGIITPQSLPRAVQQVKLLRPTPPQQQS
ncbi:CBS domain-containing protein [Granulicella paludicola]|uniref:CBS domain-containing protein n=1 Tax=Granulicella paludicola TaxID=474951 RepID=UPI0021DF5727|nr:CBS domain-containing protein [Granulicella paludicola]